MVKTMFSLRHILFSPLLCVAVSTVLAEVVEVTVEPDPEADPGLEEFTTFGGIGGGASSPPRGDSGGA